MGRCQEGSLDCFQDVMLFAHIFYRNHEVSAPSIAGLQMVAGRFINVYHTNDWTLGIIFRARQVIGLYLMITYTLQ